MTSTDTDPLALHHTVSGGGAPVVFTHGWLNSGDVWSEVVEQLDGAVRSVTWDLRGHGRSAAARPGEYGRTFAIDDLRRMIDAVGRPAILVGHSLGGYLSLAHAILHPDEVAGLVLVAAGPGFRNLDSRTQWNDMVRKMAAKADIPDGMEEISMHVDAMVIDRLAEISAPVYTVVGERDSRFLASADLFDNNLNVVKRAQIPDAGHMVHVKFPAAVADGVRFLAGISG